MASVVSVYTGATSATSGAKSVNDVTIPAGATTALIGFCKFAGNETQTLTSVTLDSQTASFVNGYTTFGLANETHVWRVSGFSSGTNKTLSFTLGTESIVTDGVAIAVVFLQDENTAAPVSDSDIASNASASATSTTPSLTIGATELVVSFAATDNTATPTYGAGQTAIAGPVVGLTGGIGELYVTTETPGGNGTQSITGDYTSITAIVVANAAGGGAALSIAPIMQNYRNMGLLH